MYSEVVCKKIEILEKEVKALKCISEKETTFKGLLKGLKFEEPDFEEAKKAVFRE